MGFASCFAASVVLWVSIFGCTCKKRPGEPWSKTCTWRKEYAGEVSRHPPASETSLTESRQRFQITLDELTHNFHFEQRCKKASTWSSDVKRLPGHHAVRESNAAAAAPSGSWRLVGPTGVLRVRRKKGQTRHLESEARSIATRCRIVARAPTTGTLVQATLLWPQGRLCSPARWASPVRSATAE